MRNTKYKFHKKRNLTTFLSNLTVNLGTRKFRNSAFICPMKRKKLRIKSSLEAENIVKRWNKAYILMESLIALALLSCLVTVVLQMISDTQRTIKADNQRIEALNVAVMAVQTNQNNLKINGENVKIEKAQNQLTVKNNDEKILEITKN